VTDTKIAPFTEREGTTNMDLTKKPDMHPKWVLVTPALAAEWLARNPRNRHLRYRIVDKYAADMSAGNWAAIGDPIRRTADGDLLDGQHRLNAIIKADVPVWMLVIEGVDASTQAVMDTGTARLYSDQLRIQGKTHTTLLASTLRWAITWERGDRMHSFSAAPPTHKELERTQIDHPELEESAAFAAVAAKRIRVPPSVFAIAHWLFSAIDKAEAEWFLSRASDGTELSADHPAYAFRERVRRDRENNRKVSNPVHLALLIIAWNAYRDGRPLTKLQLPQAGLNNGNYPVPK
jgi:hypothetical protein